MDFSRLYEHAQGNSTVFIFVNPLLSTPGQYLIRIKTVNNGKRQSLNTMVLFIYLIYLFCFNSNFFFLKLQN